MSRRNLIIVISALLLVVVLAIVLWFVFGNSNQTDVQTDGNTNTNATSNTNTTITDTTSQNTNTETTNTQTVDRNERQAISSVASSFTERFGSYSTDTHFENIERSRYLMTDAMNRQADTIVRQGESADDFASVLSTVTGVSITDYSDGATGATAEVSVRQTLRDGVGNTTYENKKANLTLKKVGSQWLVDSFRWL